MVADFFNLSRNSLTEKVLLYSKFVFENQMLQIKRYAIKCIYQPSYAEQWSLVTDFSIHTIHPWKILIIHTSDHTLMKNTYNLTHVVSPRTG